MSIFCCCFLQASAVSKNQNKYSKFDTSISLSYQGQFDEKSDCFDEFFTIVDCCCCCCCNEFPTAAAAGVAAWVCGAAGDAVAFSRTFADDFVLPRLLGFQPFSRRNLSMSSYISFPESLAYFSSPFSLIFPVGLRKSPMKTLVLKLKCSRWRFLTPFFSRYYKE